MRIEESPQRFLLPPRQFFDRKRFKEFGTNRQYTFQCPRLPFAPYLADRNKACHRLWPTRNDHVFAFSGTLNEARQLRLRFVNSDLPRVRPG